VHTGAGHTLRAVLRFAPLAVLVVLLAAACGPPGPKVYSPAKTRACLTQGGHKLKPPPASDFVASTALGGAFRLKLAHNFVTVSFGDTIKNANALVAVYRSVHTKNVGIDDVLRQMGSAVMLWHAHPSDGDLGIVEGCLKT
jgi:hypothetical protein